MDLRGTGGAVIAEDGAHLGVLSAALQGNFGSDPFILWKLQTDETPTNVDWMYALPSAVLVRSAKGTWLASFSRVRRLIA
jgi:hypothetical protein